MEPAVGESMLIPAIDVDPARCVSVPDSHVVKLIAEVLQIVSTAARVLLGADELGAVADALVKSTHAHHPYTRWACESRAHVMWLVRVGTALCAEKRRRWPANAPHTYEAHYAKLEQCLPADMRALPALLDEAQLPRVCASETAVPDAGQRRIIAAALEQGRRARAFQLYYVFAKLSNPRIARFGGAAETQARRIAKRTNRTIKFSVPALWASFALTEQEQALMAQ